MNAAPTHLITVAAGHLRASHTSPSALGGRVE